MARKSIFRKFTLLVIPLTVVTALAIGLGLAIVSHQAFLSTIQADYRVASAQAARHIELYLTTAFDEVKAMASYVAAIRLDNWRTHMAFLEMKHELTHFQYISLVDLKGQELANAWFNQDLYNRQAWHTFQEALQGRLAYSRTVILDRVPVMFLAHPVYYDGRLTAVVWARLNLKPVWDVIIQLKRDLNFGPEAHVYLVDQNRTLISSDEVSRRFGQKMEIEAPADLPQPPPLDIHGWEEKKKLDTHDPATLKSLLLDRRHRPDFWIAPYQDKRTIFLRVEVRDLGWTLYMTQPYWEAFFFLNQALWLSLGVVVAAVLVGTLLAWLTTRRILTPLGRLHQGVARAAQGNLTEPIDTDSIDEVGDLAAHFNEMQTALKDYLNRLVTAMTDLNHAKCLAVLGTTASKVNHQVGNFLNNLILALAILKADQLSAESRASLAIIEENTRQILNFTESLLSFSRKAELNLTVWHPVEELARLLAENRTQAESKGLDLRLQDQPTPPVLADQALLHQALANLLQNAIEASDPGGRITVRVESEGERIRIEVEDDGRGIPAQDLPNVFTPFFTTKKGKGTGLGLALVQTVLQAHGGETSLTSEEGRGTKAICWLPIAPAQNLDPGFIPPGLQPVREMIRR
ncbi:MAG: sensor histidine kinase [Thermodesulfobacteriota bacterium]